MNCLKLVADMTFEISVIETFEKVNTPWGISFSIADGFVCRIAAAMRITQQVPSRRVQSTSPALSDA